MTRTTADGISRRLLCVEPWKASGLGSQNAGLTAYYEVLDCHTGQERIESVTRHIHKLTDEQLLALKVALAVQDVLRGAFGEDATC